MSKHQSGAHPVGRGERRHTRTPVDLSATVSVAGDGTSAEPFVARVTNLGQGGAFIEGPPLPFGTTLLLQVEAPGERPLELRAIVRWGDDTGFGVQFMSVGVRQTAALDRLTAA